MGSFCVIGLGRYGKKLAQSLVKGGNQVLVIDKNETLVGEMADIVTDSVIGDATNEKVLLLSGAKNYDCAIICFSRNINDSVLLTIMLKELKVPKVVVRASNEQHKRVLEKIGADMIVFPEDDMAEKTAYMLERANVLEYIEFTQDYSIAEVRLPSSWLGKTLRSVDVRKTYGISVLAIKNGDSLAVTVEPDTPFRPGDTLMILGKNKDINDLSKVR